jgi:hypothetical protein
MTVRRRWPSFGVVSILTLGLATVATVLTAAPASAAPVSAATTCLPTGRTDSPGQVTLTFTFTGSECTWTPPNGVEIATVTAWGGNGYHWDFPPGPHGGLGGEVQATLSNMGGQTYDIDVGGNGDGLSQGWPDGGVGGSGGTAPNSGGGSTSMYQSAQGVHSKTELIVAGGGGGPGMSSNGGDGGNGQTLGAFGLAAADGGDGTSQDPTLVSPGGGGLSGNHFGSGGAKGRWNALATTSCIPLDDGFDGGDAGTRGGAGANSIGQGGHTVFPGGGGGGGAPGGGGGGSGGLSCSNSGGGGGGGGASVVWPNNATTTAVVENLTPTPSPDTTSGNGELTITYANPVTQIALGSTTHSGQVSGSADLGAFSLSLQDSSGVSISTHLPVTVDLASSSPGATFSLTQGGALITSLVVPNGASTAQFYYGDTLAGHPTLTLSAVGLNSGTGQPATLQAAAETQLVFVNAQQTGRASAGASVSGLVVQRQDQFGNPVDKSSSEAVTLSSNSTGTPTFFDGPTSTTTVFTQSGGSTATFDFGDTLVGTTTINATILGLTPATQTVTIVGGPPASVAFTTPARTGPASSTANLGPITLQLLDQWGQPTAPDTTLPVHLSASGGAGTPSFSQSLNGSSTDTLYFLPGAAASQTFYFGDTQAGAFGVTATPDFMSPIAQTESVTTGDPAVLALTTPPLLAHISTTATLGPITVELRDALGNPVLAPPGGITLHASSTSATGVFSTSPGGPATTSFVITGTSAISFYYGDGTPGSPVITVAGTGLSSATQTEQIGGDAAALAIMPTGPLGPIVATDKPDAGPYTVELRDAAGNATPADGPLPVTLSSSSVGAVFGTTQGGPAVTSVIVPDGASSATFYYGDTVAGTSTIAAAAAGLTSGTYDQAVAPEVASQLVYLTPPLTGPASSTASLGPATVALRDKFGNVPTTSGGTTQVRLRSTSTGTTVFSLTQNGPAIGLTTTIHIDGSPLSFYYGDTLGGAPTVSAAINSSVTATEVFTITMAPAVTAGPADATVDAASSATFTAAASGYPTPTVQWQSCPASASSCAAGSAAWVAVPAATSMTLVLSATTLSMDGTKYRAAFINSAGTATTGSATLTVTPLSQAVTFTSAPPGAPSVGLTYVVSASGGSSGKAVVFSVDATTAGAGTGAAACTVSDSTVTFRHAGSCVVDADQAGDDQYAAAPTVQQVISVGKASSTTTVNVSATSLAATVHPVAPASTTPTGTVSFAVDGNPVGAASLHSGVAAIAYHLASGRAHEVSAVYAGGADFVGSSASTSRHDPTITARVSSSSAKSRYGWYRTPLTITFTCTTAGSALTTACPSPVTLRSSAGAQTVTRTILARDGGAATVTVKGINIDTGAPAVTVIGVRSGAVYLGSAPAARCAARDTVSGIVSCQLTITRRGTTVQYAATAYDRAGNHAGVHGSYQVLNFYVQGARYRAGAFDVAMGQTYTIVAQTSSRSAPRYYNAVPDGQTPGVTGPLMHAAGTTGGLHRWTLRVHIDRGIGRYRYWVMGVKDRSTMRIIRFHPS